MFAGTLPWIDLPHRYAILISPILEVFSTETAALVLMAVGTETLLGGDWPVVGSGVGGGVPAGVCAGVEDMLRTFGLLSS